MFRLYQIAPVASCSARPIPLPFSDFDSLCTKGFSVRVVTRSDADVAARFADGEAESVRELYQRFGGLVYSVAYKVLGDAGLAQDAAQQTFVQAWRAAATYDSTRALGPWLATIAQRAAIDVYRRELRHRSHQDLDVADPALVTLPPSAEQISDVWEVRQALQQLTEDERELIRLQHYGELTHTEIAQQLSIPVGTVKSRSHRAHRRLAGLLTHLRAQPPVRQAGKSNA